MSKWEAKFRTFNPPENLEERWEKGFSEFDEFDLRSVVVVVVFIQSCGHKTK